MNDKSVDESLIRARYSLERLDWHGVWENANAVLELDSEHGEAKSLVTAATNAAAFYAPKPKWHLQLWMRIMFGAITSAIGFLVVIYLFS